MKKIIAIIIAVMLICGIATAEGRIYPRFGNVVDIEYDSDFVTVDDGLGNLWDFYGVDFYLYGDIVLLVMDDNGTPDWIYDDKVKNAYRYTLDNALEFIKQFREYAESVK